ncbi:S-layer homology domain-containing protein [Cytobacillus sp. IB215316]|uniref:S-layer homology domain-containing protein n=1 Tax=Cytobacillus sp. IB215316 TaxID=3097354 RepID=UPI002A156488|nr:S-layer homology domain-containing protein [Cytobacillus sp. IB215316]MDX8363468.1 S-layer homology domain-containing protein [Cytobacillus sp. IB215316]
MKKQILKLFTSVLLIVNLFPVVNVNAENKFPDVGENHWAKKEIEFLADKGIINGYANGLFGPDDNLTRIQIALMINRDKNYDSNGETHSYNDVPLEHKNVISAVTKHGLFDDVVKGNTFDPYKKVTRAEMASILSVAYQLEGNSEFDFQDVPSTHWAYDYVQGLAANKITTGVTDTTFNPDGLVTRAQFSVFMTRILTMETPELEDEIREENEESNEDTQDISTDHTHKWSNFWMGGFVFSDNDSFYEGYGGLTLYNEDESVNLTKDTAYWINADDEYVYFINMTDNYTGYKVKKDGSGLKKIIDESMYELYVQDESIFYISDVYDTAKIIKTDLEGNKKEIIVESVHSFYVENNTIYFIKKHNDNSFGIYSIDTDGNDQKLLRDNIFATGVLSDEDYLYFQSDDEHIYRIKRDGSDLQKILDKPAHYFLFEDKIIFLEYFKNNNSQEIFNIYSSDKNGKDKTKLTTEPINSVYIINGLLFVGKPESNNLEIISIP